MNLQIEIDCAPGGVRPQQFFNNIVTKISEKSSSEELTQFSNKFTDHRPVSSRFGCWEWIIEMDDNTSKHFSFIQNIFKEELTKLHNSGAIRYASW